ncbi:WAP four-disulfide core domain protein 1 [Crocuta crocuta]
MPLPGRGMGSGRSKLWALCLLLLLPEAGSAKNVWKRALHARLAEKPRMRKTEADISRWFSCTITELQNSSPDSASAFDPCRTQPGPFTRSRAFAPRILLHSETRHGPTFLPQRKPRRHVGNVLSGGTGVRKPSREEEGGVRANLQELVWSQSWGLGLTCVLRASGPFGVGPRWPHATAAGADASQEVPVNQIRGTRDGSLGRGSNTWGNVHADGSPYEVETVTSPISQRKTLQRREAELLAQDHTAGKAGVPIQSSDCGGVPAALGPECRDGGPPAPASGPRVLDWLVQPKPRWLGGNGWLLDGPEEVLQAEACSTTEDGAEPLLCPSGYNCHILNPGDVAAGIPNRGQCVRQRRQADGRFLRHRLYKEYPGGRRKRSSSSEGTRRGQGGFLGGRKVEPHCPESYSLGLLWREMPVFSAACVPPPAPGCEVVGC